MTKVQITDGQHIMILGKTGSGKTVATKRVFLPALQKQPNGYIVVLDPKREYGDFAQATAGSPVELNNMLYSDEKPVAKTIRVLTDIPDESIAEEYLRAAWGPWAGSGRRGDYTIDFSVRFVLEDMPTFYDSAFRTPLNLRRWITMGRAYRRTIMATSQRAQLIPKTVITQVDHLFVFKVSDYDRERVIREYYGHNASAVVGAITDYGYALISDLYDEPLIFKPYTGTVPKSSPGIEIYDEKK